MKAPLAPSGGRRLASQIVMGLAVTLILLATHQTFSGVWESTSVDAGPLTGAAASIVDATHATVPHLDASSDTKGDRGLPTECGIAMLCAAVLVGLGAFILLRGRGDRAVMWSAPRSLDLVLSASPDLGRALGRTQRSPVLRC